MQHKGYVSTNVHQSVLMIDFVRIVLHLFEQKKIKIYSLIPGVLYTIIMEALLMFAICLHMYFYTGTYGAVVCDKVDHVFQPYFLYLSAYMYSIHSFRSIIRYSLFSNI